MCFCFGGAVSIFAVGWFPIGGLLPLFGEVGFLMFWWWVGCARMSITVWGWTIDVGCEHAAGPSIWGGLVPIQGSGCWVGLWSLGGRWVFVRIASVLAAGCRMSCFWRWVPVIVFREVPGSCFKVFLFFIFKFIVSLLICPLVTWTVCFTAGSAGLFPLLSSIFTRRNIWVVFRGVIVVVLFWWAGLSVLWFIGWEARSCSVDLWWYFEVLIFIRYLPFTVFFAMLFNFVVQWVDCICRAVDSSSTRLVCLTLARRPSCRWCVSVLLIILNGSILFEIPLRFSFGPARWTYADCCWSKGFMMFRMNAVRVPWGFFGHLIVNCLISSSFLFVSTNLVLS